MYSFVNKAGQDLTSCLSLKGYASMDQMRVSFRLLFVLCYLDTVDSYTPSVAMYRSRPQLLQHRVSQPSILRQISRDHDFRSTPTENASALGSFKRHAPNIEWEDPPDISWEIGVEVSHHNGTNYETTSHSFSVEQALPLSRKFEKPSADTEADR
jgi:hypothetical protein